VRVAGSVLSFQAALEVVNGAAMVVYGLTVRRNGIVAYARQHGARGLLAGAISVVGFLAFLAAAQSLPLGPVVALRETSVIFGAVLGTFVLREAFGGRRIVASTAVVLGIAMLALWR
jgi:drug/metabolite transporter (DMT)-like permease